MGSVLSIHSQRNVRPEDPVASSDRHKKNQACTHCTHMHTGKTLIHMKQNGIKERVNKLGLKFTSKEMLRIHEARALFLGEERKNVKGEGREKGLLDYSP